MVGGVYSLFLEKVHFESRVKESSVVCRYCIVFLVISCAVDYANAFSALTLLVGCHKGYLTYRICYNSSLHSQASLEISGDWK